MVNPEPTKREAIIRTPGDGLSIILIETSLAENIGMTARAMMNFGLTDLRLVRPKCKWPHTKAINASSGAHAVLTNAKIFETTAEAGQNKQTVTASPFQFQADSWKSAELNSVAASVKPGWGQLATGSRHHVRLDTHVYIGVACEPSERLGR